MFLRFYVIYHFAHRSTRWNSIAANNLLLEYDAISELISRRERNYHNYIIILHVA